jgi:hypothetical protein
MLHLMGPNRLRRSVVPEDRSSPEASRVAVRTRRDFVALVKGYREATRLAAERARSRQCAGDESVQCLSLGPDRADDNELIRP